MIFMVLLGSYTSYASDNFGLDRACGVAGDACLTDCCDGCICSRDIDPSTGTPSSWLGKCVCPKFFDDTPSFGNDDPFKSDESTNT